MYKFTISIIACIILTVFVYSNIGYSDNSNSNSNANVGTPNIQKTIPNVKVNGFHEVKK